MSDFEHLEGIAAKNDIKDRAEPQLASFLWFDVVEVRQSAAGSVFLRSRYRVFLRPRLTDVTSRTRCVILLSPPGCHGATARLYRCR
jgi:hypothetical protein